MPIVVNTNIASLQAQRNLNSATNGLNKAMERLSSGLRINNAGDDAAGLVIAKTLEAQQRGSEVAIKNAQDGFNLLATAEGNLDIMQENLLRIRDLTLQAMNGSNGIEQVKALSQEAGLRGAEVDRIAVGAKFGDFELFNRTSPPTNLFLQIGASHEKATNTIDINSIFTKATYSSLAGTAMVGSTISFMAGTATVISRTAFEGIIKDLDKALKELSVRRGDIGATQSRLEGVVDQLTIQNENISAARSRIVDADIAKESSNFIKYQILQQASSALLVQANQTPNIALTLI